MIRTQVYLNDQQYHLAKLMAAEGQTPFAEAVREGLDLWIDKQQRKKTTSKKRYVRAFEGYIGSIKGKALEPDMQVDDIYDDVLPWDREARIKAAKKNPRKRR